MQHIYLPHSKKKIPEAANKEKRDESREVYRFMNFIFKIR